MQIKSLLSKFENSHPRRWKCHDWVPGECQAFTTAGRWMRMGNQAHSPAHSICHRWTYQEMVCLFLHWAAEGSWAQGSSAIARPWSSWCRWVSLSRFDSKPQWHGRTSGSRPEYWNQLQNIRHRYAFIIKISNELFYSWYFKFTRFRNYQFPSIRCQVSPIQAKARQNLVSKFLPALAEKYELSVQIVGRVSTNRLLLAKHLFPRKRMQQKIIPLESWTNYFF